MNHLDLPKNIDLAGKIIEARQAQTTKKLEMGWIGHIFGASAEKPGNIASVLAVLSFVTIVGLFLLAPANPNFPVTEAVTLFGGILTSCLGFMFGKATN